jgi:hypothetical protein
LHYHPADPTPDELATQPPQDPDFQSSDFEFVELQNVGGHTVNLSGVRFADGIELTLDAHVLADGQRIVVTRNADAFTARYGIGGSLAGTGITLAGIFTGELDNGGEHLTLLGRDGSSLLDFSYDDGGSWPGRADGKGASLEVVALDDDYSDPDNWRSSVAYGGTPGTGAVAELGIVVNEVLSHTEPGLLDAIELHNTTGSEVDVGGWFLSDSWGWDFSEANGNYKKFRIPDDDPAATTIPAGGFLVFDEDDFNPTPANPEENHFALNGTHGDDVWLMKGDAAGNLTHFGDHVDFPAALPGEAIGRWPDGDGQLYPMSERTLGAANSQPRVGPLIVSELQYYPGLFHENFEQGEDGADRFTVIAGDWAVAGGRFRAVPGAVGEDAAATIPLGAALGTDYVLEAELLVEAAAGGY